MDVPPVEVVLGEFVVNLAALAHAYLVPAAETDAVPDLAAAEIAIDVAGRAYERVEARLPADDRAGIARILTDVRLTYVKLRSASSEAVRT